jgi:hypothetical protein
MVVGVLYILNFRSKIPFRFSKGFPNLDQSLQKIVTVVAYTMFQMYNFQYLKY